MHERAPDLRRLGKKELPLQLEQLLISASFHNTKDKDKDRSKISSDQSTETLHRQPLQQDAVLSDVTCVYLLWLSSHMLARGGRRPNGVFAVTSTALYQKYKFLR